jgi:hypothetical protein
VQQPQAGLEIKAGFFPLAFVLFFCTPHLSINGSAPIRAKWGDNLIPVEPGRHQVTMWYPYAFIKQASKATLVVDVAHGQVAQLTYRPHILYIIFLPGRLKQVGVRAMLAGGQTQIAQAVGAQPAGWHPDPSGRHEMRYWNGSVWTDDVSDAGVATKDPPG